MIPDKTVVVTSSDGEVNLLTAYKRGPAVAIEATNGEVTFTKLEEQDHAGTSATSDLAGETLRDGKTWYGNFTTIHCAANEVAVSFK